MGEEFKENAILAALPEKELARLRPMLTMTDVEARHRVYEYRHPIAEVYFPTSSVFSMVALADGRSTIEVGTIGFEGMAGLPLFLGASTSPTATFCQIPGRAARLSAADFREFLTGDGQLHSVLHRYTQTTMAQLAQNVVCNSTHSVEQRAARWLLTTSDRVRSEHFPLVQEFLAQMLGVTRPTVSETAGKLQASGLITYRRGHLTITDRTRLTEIACKCYGIIKAEFDALTTYAPAPEWDG